MRVTCSACSAAFAVSEDLVREKSVRFRCRKCGASIPVDGRSAPVGERSAAAGAVDTRGAGHELLPPPPADVLALSSLPADTSSPHPHMKADPHTTAASEAEKEINENPAPEPAPAVPTVPRSLLPVHSTLAPPSPSTRAAGPAKVLAIAGLLGLSAAASFIVLNARPARSASEKGTVAVDSMLPATPATVALVATTAPRPSRKTERPVTERARSRGPAEAATVRAAPLAHAGASRSSPEPAVAKSPSANADSKQDTDDETAADGTEFDEQAALDGIAAAVDSAHACLGTGSPTGPARIAVTFAPSGVVTNSVVEGPPFAGTLEGGCIATKFRTLRVPPFGGDGKVTVRKTVRLE